MAAHDHAPSAGASPGGWRAFVAAFTVERLLLAGMLATIAAALLNPVFVTPFAVLLARMLAIAGALLVAYAAATAWPVPALPRWLTPLLAVALAAPLATFAVYLVSVEGDVAALLKSEPRMTGFVLVTVTVLAIAPLVTLVMLYRERDAQARNEALQFALQKSTLERQALDAQLKLLHAQIEPHFLFNTLANVQELVESGSPRAAPVLASLIAYLRAAVPTLNNEAATLGEEAALVRAYLALMHMRMPDRLSYAVDIPAALAQLEFPAMALLTLVENAVHHGIDPSEQGGRIDVSARLDPVSGRVTVGVVDTGMGIDAKAAAGTGLANLRARLAARYGPDAQLELAEQAPHGVRAEITLVPKAPA
jgi:sensor histidine kinase YesM